MEQQARRGRPRRAEVDDRILEATRALLREHGPTSVHIDAVAARSGVARTTIYRRYRDRRELLSRTLAQVTDQGAPPPEVDLDDKVRWLLQRVRAVLRSGLGGGTVAAVLTDADPEFTETLRASLESHLEPLLAAMADDVQRGHLRPGVDPDTVVNVALGAYLGELIRYGEERDGWLDRTSALLDHAIRPDG